MRLWQFFLPYPQEIVDHGLELTLGEYRLLGYLIRHQLRLGKASIKLSQDEVLCGRKLPDGRRVDSGCHLSCSRDLIDARDRLIKRGWITYRSTPEGFVYEIVIAEQPALSTRSTESTGQVQNAPNQQVQNAPGSGSKCTRDQVQNAPAHKGSRRSVEGQKKEPSDSDESDARHKEIKAFLIECHSKANDMRIELVEWDGREGRALSKLLRDKKGLTVEDARRCTLNYYRSKIDVCVRLAKFIPRMLEFYADALDDFKKPNYLTPKREF